MVVNVRQEAVSRLQGATAPPEGQPPTGGVPPTGEQAGTAKTPVDQAVRVFELVVARLAQIKPEAAQKLGAAVEQLKAAIEEVKKEMASAPAGQPPGATPGGQPPARPAMPARGSGATAAEMSPVPAS